MSIYAAKAEAELQRLYRVKQASAPDDSTLGPEMISYFNQTVQKRQTKLGKISEAWAQLVPETLLAHSTIESYHRGTLVVLVDTAAHLYELKQLLLAGLEDQLLLACKTFSLRKINLKPGGRYDGKTERPPFSTRSR